MGWVWHNKWAQWSGDWHVMLWSVLSLQPATHSAEWNIWNPQEIKLCGEFPGNMRGSSLRFFPAWPCIWSTKEQVCFWRMAGWSFKASYANHIRLFRNKTGKETFVSYLFIIACFLFVSFCFVFLIDISFKRPAQVLKFKVENIHRGLFHIFPPTLAF